MKAPKKKPAQAPKAAKTQTQPDLFSGPWMSEKSKKPGKVATSGEQAARKPGKTAKASADAT